MRNIKKVNQSGASAIMFAMVFIVVISLIAIGFATLARRDQRAALDKNISQEAQLAAESGANSVKEYIKTKLANNETPLTKSACSDANPAGYVSPSLSGGPQITCITWNVAPSIAEKTLGAYETWSFEDTQPTGTTYITFSSSNGDAYGSTLGRRSLPNLESGKLPIIKVAEVSKADLSNSETPKVEIFYLVPANNNNGTLTTVSLDDFSGPQDNDQGNAVAYGINCLSGVCRARINSYPFPGDGNGNSPRLFFFQAIGDKPVTITYSDTEDGTGGTVTGVQAEVDVNVKINDQTKRIRARIPFENQTWQPWFAALANQLCKDIRVDGSNTNGKIPDNNIAACINN
jgi:Tfp pilus assembly protein PilX